MSRIRVRQSDPALDVGRQFTLRPVSDPATGAAGDRTAWSLIDVRTGVSAGSASVRGAGAPHSVVVDYTLSGAGPEAGAGTDLLRALADLHFHSGTQRVEIYCPLTRTDQVAGALAAGFRFEGVRRASSLPADPACAVLARLRTDSGQAIAPFLPPLGPGGLSDGVVTLRVVTAADADALDAEQNNPEARRWSLWSPGPKAETTIRAAVAGLEWLVGPAGLMAITEAASGQVAGRLAARAVVPPGVADVGYGVLPAFRGRNYAARALRLFADWAFEETRYTRLELGVKPLNIGSWSAALAGGFHPEGTRAARLRNTDGSFSDEIHFALVAPPSSATGRWRADTDQRQPAHDERSLAPTGSHR